MKKQVQSMLLLIGASLFILIGCKKEQIKYTYTTFTRTTTQTIKPGVVIGYFTSSGDPTTAGTWIMYVTPVGSDSLHCSQTLDVPSEGTITVLTFCSLANNTGAWRVLKGTGAYSNLHGNGSLVMSFPKSGPSIEIWNGKTWRQ